MTLVALASIRLDGGTQSRAELRPEVVTDYAEKLDRGVQLPAPIVFHDGSDYWCADGFHRVHAYRQIDRKRIECEVHQGTLRDAILFSVGANAAHGLCRTNADKRRAVELLLRDEEWQKKSDRWIAEKCGVGNAFASKLRGELCTEHSSPERLGQDGKVRKLPVAKPKLAVVEPVESPAEPQEPPRKPFVSAYEPFFVPKGTSANADPDSGTMRTASAAKWECRLCATLWSAEVEECAHCAEEDDDESGKDSETPDADEPEEFVPELAASKAMQGIDQALRSWPESAPLDALAVALHSKLHYVQGLCAKRRKDVANG